MAIKNPAYYLSIVAVLLVCITSGCALTGAESDLDKLEGEWSWLKSTGGVAGHTITPDSAGYSEQRLLFTWDEEYYFYQADTLRHNGIYAFERLENELYLVYDSGRGPFPEQIVEFPDIDTLILYDQCTDCYKSTYVRISE